MEPYILFSILKYLYPVSGSLDPGASLRAVPPSCPKAQSKCGLLYSSVESFHCEEDIQLDALDTRDFGLYFYSLT
jgi:hypothetical protein